MAKEKTDFGIVIGAIGAILFIPAIIMGIASGDFSPFLGCIIFIVLGVVIESLSSK
jgi:hypothetical protein